MSWDIRGSQWLNIPLITVMFKSCGKHGRPPPSILLISSSLSCLFPTFALSLLFVCVCVCVWWGGSITLVLSSHKHQTPPLPPTSIPTHFSPSIYPRLPCGMSFPPKTQPNPPPPIKYPCLPGILHSLLGQYFKT